MKNFIFGLVVCLAIFSSRQAQAWGGRGHHTICEVAVHLVKDKELKEFLQTRPHTMGHLCNVPDIYWKSLGGEARKTGDPAHYIDPEVLGLSIMKIPTDYKKIIEEYTGKQNGFKPGATIFSVPLEVGSLWWRADQFMRRIAARKEQFQKAAIPQGSKQEFDEQFEYNQLVYQTMIDMGVMGHYVGDNSQPFHTTSDHDGWNAGHGGIHSYYEEIVVAQFDGTLVGEVLAKARAIEKSKEEQSFLTPATTVEKMRALSYITHEEIQTVLKKDPILKKSEVKEDKGMQVRVQAERKGALEGGQVFKRIIVKDMSRSALLLAKLWDDAYVSLGKPNLKAYKSYRYPFTPEFVVPDYYEVKADSSVDKKTEKK